MCGEVSLCADEEKEPGTLSSQIRLTHISISSRLASPLIWTSDSAERLARELGVVGSLDLLEGEEAGGAAEDQPQKGPMPVPDPHLPHQSRSMPPLPPGQSHHHHPQEMNIGMTQVRLPPPVYTQVDS